MKKLFLGIAILLACCDQNQQSSGQSGSSPAPAATPTPPADIFDHQTKEDRYADFTAVTDVEFKSPQGIASLRYPEKITVKFTPTRVGAYLIDGWQETQKVFSTSQDATPDTTLEFHIMTQSFTVVYSDGKCIERTVVMTGLK